MKAGKVLIVEDEKDLREVYELVLSSAGHSVATAANGQEALQAVEKDEPEVVLLDIFMPIMDGRTFLEKVSLQDHPNMKVIVCSNTSDSSLTQQMLKLGAVEVVTKADLGPSDIAKLVGAYA